MTSCVSHGVNQNHSRVFLPSTFTFSTILGAKSRGYREKSQVEEMLASYLSPALRSSIK